MADFLAYMAEFFKLLLFVLPAWAANSSPVLLGGAWPIDHGADFFDGKRFFGKSKTWLGLAAGISTGALCAVLEAHFLPGSAFAVWGAKPSDYIIGGLLLSIGAMAGDLAGSFLKRRLSQQEGTSSFALDQLPFIAMALLFVLPLAPQMLTLANVAVLFVVTFFAHRIANWWAHTAGLKKVPW